MGLNFLRMGTTGVTAQAFGSANQERIAESLIQPLVMAAVLAVGILLLQTATARSGVVADKPRG